MIRNIEEMTTFTAMSPAPKPIFSSTESFAVVMPGRIASLRYAVQ
jgi:hypothetical protein